MGGPRTLPVRADTNVDDLVSRYPSTAEVFARRRMLCVGCPLARFETLAEVCRIYRQPLEAMLNDLRAAVARPRP